MYAPPSGDSPRASATAAAALPVERLMRRLSSIEARPGPAEAVLGAMTDLLVADTGAFRADLEVWHHRTIAVHSGDEGETEGSLEEPITFGSAKIGTIRLHGSHDQVEQWRSAGFATLATHLGGLVTAHLNHGAAEQASNSRDQLLASVSHELRTPLTFISGIVSELLTGADLSDIERRSLLDLISDQCADMEKIVEDLLAGAQVGADRLQLTIDTVDLAEQALKVANTARITLAASPHPGQILSMGDERRVRQILRNLLTNAQRYGGPTIAVSAFRDVRRAYIAVCDNGAPIPIDQRRHLFEDFARIKTGRQHPASVGIGLSVSKRLASLMGGSLGYEHDGRQSRFILGLPIAPARR